MDAPKGDAGRRPLSRRRLLRAAGEGTAVLLGAWALITTGCGGKESAPAASGKSGGGGGTTSKPKKAVRPHRPIGSRPANAKTTKAKHRPPQPSASRSKAPLPAELVAYAERKAAEGALVRSGKTPTLHHPVVCRKHLAAAKTAGGPAPAGAKAKLHAQVADGILYALLRAEKDAGTVLRLALVGAAAWPVSTHFADLALSRLRAAGTTEPTDAAVRAALEGLGVAAADAAPLAPRAGPVLRERLASRGAPREARKKR